MIYLFSRLKLKIFGAKIGVNCKIHNPLVYNPKNFEFGSHCYLGPQARIYARGNVRIGDGTIIGPRLTIHSSNHDFNSLDYLPYGENYIHKEVIIGKGVWIGDSVIINPGAVIPDGCVIGAGSVVRGKLEPYKIYIGNPAVLYAERPNLELCVSLVKNKNFYLGRSCDVARS